jgi:hypothetical protein
MDTHATPTRLKMNETASQPACRRLLLNWQGRLPEAGHP